MIKVITLSDFAPDEFSARASPEALMSVVDNVMTAARAFWVKRAQETLSGSKRADYIHGIQPVEVGEGYAAITLLGEVPNMIEEGQDPYDMHSTLLGPQVPVVPARSGLKGKHALKDGTGFWRIIPFRHQTPGTQGKAGGTPMGEAYDEIMPIEDAKKLGKMIYAVAKKLEGTKGMPGGKVMWGGRLPAGLAPKLKPHHSTDIFAGMVRVEKDYQNATQSTYMTFRVISDSVPDKWKHGGSEPADLAYDVAQFIEQTAGAAFAALFDDED